MTNDNTHPTKSKCLNCGRIFDMSELGLDYDPAPDGPDWRELEPLCPACNDEAMEGVHALHSPENPYLVSCLLNRGQVEAMLIELAPIAYPEELPHYVKLPKKHPFAHHGNVVDAFNALLHYSKGGK